jgi:hypothetical protein
MSDNSLSKNEGHHEALHVEKSSLPVTDQSDLKGLQELDDEEWSLDYKIILTFAVRILIPLSRY